MKSRIKVGDRVKYMGALTDKYERVGIVEGIEFDPYFLSSRCLIRFEGCEPAWYWCVALKKMLSSDLITAAKGRQSHGKQV